jgi:hypothetical protein
MSMTTPELSIEQDPQRERIPLSFNQEFVCLFEKGEGAGPFGPHYHIVHGWHLRGKVDADALRAAMTDVVTRHETLRSIIVRDDGERYQRVLPPMSPELSVLDLTDVPAHERDDQVERLLNEVETGTLPATEVPHIRGLLGRFGPDHAILVLIANHTATDGFSMRLIIRDLAICYAHRRGLVADELPEVAQYREYATWQRAGATLAAAEPARAYWREQLAGARIFAMPTDRPKTGDTTDPTAVYRFTIGPEVIGPALAAAREMRSTPFMVMLSVYNILLHRRTGVTDVVVPTFTPGREHERFENTVGSFFNFLPLRTDITGCRTFREVAESTRKTCIGGYAHDIPFMQVLAEAPELMMPAMAPDAAANVFQVFPFPFVLDAELVGDLEYTEVRRRMLSQQVGSDIPDGALWTLNLHPDGDVVGSVQYKSKLYDRETIALLVSDFTDALRDLVAAPDAPLA